MTVNSETWKEDCIGIMELISGSLVANNFKNLEMGKVYCKKAMSLEVFPRSAVFDMNYQP